MPIFDKNNKPVESQSSKQAAELAEQEANEAKARTNRKYKRRAWYTVVLFTILAMTYGTTRPGVVTEIRTTVRYFSGEVQKKAWNEAKREVLEAEIKGRETELEQVKPQSFWTPEIVKQAHAQIIEQIEPETEANSQETIPASVGPEAPHSKTGGGTIPKSIIEPATNGVPGNYARFEEMAAAAGLTPAKTALLKRIGECESGFRMIPNHNGASSAYGIFQLLKVHDARAKRLGGTRMQLDTQIATAIELFQEQGTTPWNASKSCWGKK